MRLVVGLGQTGYRHYFFQISDNDLIAFFEWPSVEPVAQKQHGRPVSGPFMFDHVSFGVETEEDLWELKDKLTAAGFHVSGVIDHGFIHSVYTHDPNGIPIEFSHNVVGVDIRKTPRMADPEPSSITREGPEPQPDKWHGVHKTTSPGERRVYPGAGSELFHGTKEVD
jgi:catechol 2,3-dioxygenase-like lactoylglutathione lyase family enzyme